MREEAVAMACICKAGFARAALVLLAVMAPRIDPTDAVTDPNDTLALQAFKRTLLDPDLHLSNWKGNNPCEIGWNGVICSPPTGPNNITNVIELRLFLFNLGGSLDPALGNLSNLETLNVMWNNLTGSIPSSFGQLLNLQFLLLSGNQLSGILPPELGQLPQLNRIQIDQNQITGPIPTAFGGLRKIEHLHMSNNLLNGTIPKELGALPLLTHILLDNNALSGELPSEIANATLLQIIQLDNNRFSENATIPTTWWNITTLNKLSLSNCSISGPMILDLGGLPTLNVLDLSHNNLTGAIPSTLPTNLTSLDLSNNQLTLQIPDSIGSLQHLEVLMMRNNRLSGFVPMTLGTAPTFNRSNFKAVIDFQNNTLESAGQLANLVAYSNTAVRFAGNPAVCPANMSSPASNPLCIPVSTDVVPYGTLTLETEYPSNTCFSCENITVGFRLVSPGFSLFDRYDSVFVSWISAGLNLTVSQVFLRDYMWQEGPQLALTILLFPDINHTRFVDAEFYRLYNSFSQWLIPDSKLFGPYELLSFEPRSAQIVGTSKKGLSALVITAIVLGVAAFAVLVTSLLFTLVCRPRRTPTALRAQMSQLVRMTKAKKNPALKVDGVEFFTFKDLSKVTNRFSASNEIGEGGYGKVYLGTLAEKKQQVAIKRAQRDSLQRSNEFYTEIEFMSRCHHRNLVKLVGYCDDEGEQMLVYEYMPGGTLRQQLEFRKKGRAPLDFPTRLRIAIGSARGLLYLHTEADPPIIHRDIKANNILLNDLMVAKVADFGLSKQAPGPDIHGNIAKHISTGVKGTFGYIDPEYYLTHQLTEKSDVFSFGVVLLEIVTGKRASKGNKSLLQEVQLKEESGHILTVVDPEVVHYPWGTLERFMRLALRCCERLPDDRPNMAEVVRALEDIASSSSDSSSPDPYILDLSHTDEDDPYSIHSLPASDSGRSDTVELLSKTVSFVKVR